jgi:hypothetical protein
MKYLILIVALLGILLIGPSPKVAHCDNCDEYIGKKCFSDFGCNTLMCNLVCTPIDNIVFNKKCLVR